MAKQRQRAQGAAVRVEPTRRPKRDDREIERVRDVARRPKKYFLAKRLQESELTLAALASPPVRRRRTVAVSRGPVTRTDSSRRAAA
jgi:hypothetical protein